VVAEHQKYWGSESMGWDKGGCGRGWPPPTTGVCGSTPGIFFVRIFAFWFILGKKVCYCHGLLRWGHK